MQICASCGAKAAEGLRRCPICGARLDRIAPAEPDLAQIAPAEPGAALEPTRGTRIPKTVPELRDFCAAHRLPLEQMRFAIGYDTPEPRMFGICRTADGAFLVYKNKADGSRAVRYQGPDEAFAVREIYEKMKSEIALRRGPGGGQTRRGAAPTRQGGALRTADASGPPRRTHRRATARRGGFPWAALLFILGVAAAVFLLYRALRGDGPLRGYYSYRDTEYYYDAEDWYYWDALEALWLPAVLDEGFLDDADSYYSHYSYPDGAPYGDFEDSEWYVPYSSYDDDSDDDDWDRDWDDDDWDWDDGDDWDSWDTDWDSDW